MQIWFWDMLMLSYSSTPVATRSATDCSVCAFLRLVQVNKFSLKHLPVTFSVDALGRYGRLLNLWYAAEFVSNQLCAVTRYWSHVRHTYGVAEWSLCFLLGSGYSNKTDINFFYLSSLASPKFTDDFISSNCEVRVIFVVVDHIFSMKFWFLNAHCLLLLVPFYHWLLWLLCLMLLSVFIDLSLPSVGNSLWDIHSTVAVLFIVWLL